MVQVLQQYVVKHKGFMNPKLTIATDSGAVVYHAYPTYDRALLKDHDKQLIAQVVQVAPGTKARLLDRTVRYLTFPGPDSELGAKYSLVGLERTNGMLENERFDINLTTRDGVVTTYYWKQPTLLSRTWGLYAKRDGHDSPPPPPPLMTFKRGILSDSGELSLHVPLDPSDTVIFLLVFAFVYRRCLTQEEAVS